MHTHFDRHLNIKGLIEKYGVKEVLELGAMRGDHTRKLLTVAKVHVITDNAIPDDPLFLEAAVGGRLFWEVGVSYRALVLLPDDSIEMALVDTDHNSWTLERELFYLSTKVKVGGLVVIHDTVSFAHSNGTMPGRVYCNGELYPYAEIILDERPYADAIEEFLDVFEVVGKSQEDCGAVALRRTV